MTPAQAAKKIREKVDAVNEFRKNKLPDIVGTEAVEHFKESFVNEGFTDKSLVKWKDVKRRDPNSPWYGFAPDNKNRFSQTRALDKILTGDTKELQNALKYVKKTGRVTVSNDKPYASVHQFGEPAKIFGKKSFTMPKRPFVGKSEVLEQKILNKIERELEKISKGE